MLETARSRYILAAALWAGTASWIAIDPDVRGLYPMLVALLAVTSTICAAIVEREEQVQRTIRLAWWAATAVAPPPPKFPRQGSVPAWPGVDRAAD